MNKKKEQIKTFFFIFLRYLKMLIIFLLSLFILKNFFFPVEWNFESIIKKTNNCQEKVKFKRREMTVEDLENTILFELEKEKKYFSPHFPRYSKEAVFLSSSLSWKEKKEQLVKNINSALDSEQITPYQLLNKFSWKNCLLDPLNFFFIYPVDFLSQKISFFFDFSFNFPVWHIIFKAFLIKLICLFLFWKQETSEFVENNNVEKQTDFFSSVLSDSSLGELEKQELLQTEVKKQGILLLKKLFFSFFVSSLIFSVLFHFFFFDSVRFSVLTGSLSWWVNFFPLATVMIFDFFFDRWREGLTLKQFFQKSSKEEIFMAIFWKIVLFVFSALLIFLVSWHATKAVFVFFTVWRFFDFVLRGIYVFFFLKKKKKK